MDGLPVNSYISLFMVFIVLHKILYKCKKSSNTACNKKEQSKVNGLYNDNNMYGTTVRLTNDSWLTCSIAELYSFNSIRTRGNYEFESSTVRWTGGRRDLIWWWGNLLWILRLTLFSNCRVSILEWSSFLRKYKSNKFDVY